MLGRLFRMTSRFAWQTLAIAVVLVGLGVYVAPGAIKMLGTEGFFPKNAESTQVSDELRANFTKDEPSVIVIMQAKRGTVNNTNYQAAVRDITAQIQKESAVKAVNTYLNAGKTFVSKDQKASFAIISINGSRHEQQDVAVQLRNNLRNTELQLSYGGAAILNHDITAQINHDLGQAEVLSFIVLAVLLVVVFRSLVAALLPLLLGGFSIIVALLSLRLLVEFTTIVEYALNVIILIGLGLAVDYSLLMVSRFREELVAHKGNVDEALAVTLKTAGRTIVFSGLTVIISLLVLVVFPLDFLKSMGLGGATAVFISMLGALVVLPALLKVLGRRVNWLSFGQARRQDNAIQAGVIDGEGQTIWYKTGAFFMKQPLITIAVTLIVLLGAGTPFLHAKLTEPDHTVLPPDSIARQVTERLRTDFGFNNDPIKVIYTTKLADGITGEAATKAIQDYEVKLRDLSGVESVQGIVDLPTAIRKVQEPTLISGNSTVISINFAGGTMDTATQDLVRSVRKVQAPDAQVKAGGNTAALVDLLDTLATYIPIAAAIIGVTLFVLLFLMLGSIIIPLNAIIQNVLSLSTSFGALVLIFQEKHFADFLHINATGSIDATQPVLIFAAAFGLSMDYAVFLYSRIKEEYDKTGDNTQAVLGGLQKSGPIITSAAILLFVVVVAFATGRISVMQQIGVGLALAILVDAFIVRMVLVPATMRLFGKVNWWAPAFLKRLHHKIGLSD